MQEAVVVLNVLRERGRKGLPFTQLYRQMFNKDLYLLAYGNIYSNQGAMTPGASEETADGMSEDKIDQIIEAMRHERYRFRVVSRSCELEDLEGPVHDATGLAAGFGDVASAGEMVGADCEVAHSLNLIFIARWSSAVLAGQRLRARVGMPSSTVFWLRVCRSIWASLSSAPARLIFSPSTSPSQP